MKRLLLLAALVAGAVAPAAGAGGWATVQLSAVPTDGTKAGAAIAGAAGAAGTAAAAAGRYPRVPPKPPKEGAAGGAYDGATTPMVSPRAIGAGRSSGRGSSGETRVRCSRPAGTAGGSD